MRKPKKMKKIVYFILAVIVSIPMLFPFYWILISSLKSDGEIFLRIPTFWPKVMMWSNYVEQFQSSGMGTALKSSFIIAVVSMIVSIALSVPAAYGLARFKTKMTKIFIMIFLVTQMLPTSLTLTPMYLIFNKLHLLNNYFSAIFSTATISIPFIILVLRPIFLAIPYELEEAAYIDGCSNFAAFVKIILPTAKSGIVTGMCFSFVYAWNDLIYSITFNTKDSLRPLTTIIYNYLNMYGTQWNMIMAYGVIMIIPVLLIFIFLQRFIIKGFIAGAVKG